MNALKTIQSHSVNNISKKYLYAIGRNLGNLGYELCQQANSPELLNIHGLVKRTMDSLTYTLHNLNADLDACRYTLIKDGYCNINATEIESLKGTLHHLLNGECYTHNGETSNPTAELYKMMFMIDSIYRLMSHGSAGAPDYIFDKITDKDR